MTKELSKTKVMYNEDMYHLALCNYGGEHYSIQINNVSMLQTWNREMATMLYEMLKHEILQPASLDKLINYYNARKEEKKNKKESTNL